MQKPGLFITLEGIEGTGKSTQARLLADKMSRLPGGVILVREPGGDAACEQIRDIIKRQDLAPIAELLLFNASRAQLVRNVIEPALRQGTTVICDRFVHSTVAYQQYGNGLCPEIVCQICHTAMLNSNMNRTVAPDLVLWFDMPVTQALARASGRQSADAIKKYDNASLKFMRRVARGYELMAKTAPNMPRINAALSVDAVASEVWRRVKILCTAQDLAPLPAKKARALDAARIVEDNT